ncbi:CD209 antigen-like protein E [Scomber japonicus]|uniref:CD209 antigen-like protein E n=1 Tax=Scomber japonicus TaxID=13676 RepID=UPI002306BF62|nr:CD209 antigen-like protein E [Scomber japonicus]
MERNQVLAEFANLTSERDELQRKLTDLEKMTLDMEASIKTLTEERDELQRKLSDLDDYSQQGFLYFSGSFYYVSSHMDNWYNSRSDCLDKGADLLIINTKEEQEFLNQYRRITWIGLTDKEAEDRWKWVDGTPLTTSFWHRGEPSHGEKQDCVETKYFTDTNSWDDADCAHRNFWICEKKAFV